jgi:hypothetical protein
MAGGAGGASMAPSCGDVDAEGIAEEVSELVPTEEPLAPDDFPLLEMRNSLRRSRFTAEAGSCARTADAAASEGKAASSMVALPAAMMNNSKRTNGARKKNACTPVHSERRSQHVKGRIRAL